MSTTYIGQGLVEAESLTLTGAYAVEARADASGGADIKASGSGTASASFAGPAGDYWIDVGWFNEGDGESPFTLSVDGVAVDGWTGTGGSGGAGVLETRRIAVTLAEGSTIELAGAKDAGEYARVDYLAVEARSDDPPPPPLPDDGAVGIGVGLTEAESLTLAGAYAVEARADASGGADIKASGSGTASASFAGPAGDYWIDIGWFNEGDGESPFTLSVDGVAVDSWTGTGGSGGAGVLETRRIAVALAEGSTIELAGAKDAGEYARVDYLAVEARSDDPPPPVSAPATGWAAPEEDSFLF